MNLIRAIEEYNKNGRVALNKTKKYYRSIIEIDVVIFKAAHGQIPIDNNGNTKMDSHQYRVGRKKCKKGYEKLMQNLTRIEVAKNFEEVFIITEEVRKSVDGLGDLWSYDTALRICFYFNFKPNDVYVQCGVKEGLKKLGYKRVGRRILKNDLPIELQELEPYEIENFLCIYGKDNSN